MVKESSLETTPGLIALIDNPTEEDLLKVIYSDKVTLDIIKELPDKSITPRVATIALCLDKRWSREELLVWFNKFIPYVNPKGYLKVFIIIEDKLPASIFSSNQKDWDLFTRLFSKVDNPPKELIDFYLKICVNNNLFGISEYTHKVSEHTCKVYELDTKGITNNLKDALDNNQTSLIYAHLMSNDIITHSIYFDPDINTLVLTNKWGLKKLSSFLRKEDCEDISSELEELNKPYFDKGNKQEDIYNSNKTTNPYKKVSVWERILKVFKS
ncbi:hypothetical protein HWC08_gp053 [Lactobacillus phage 521B]|uniref:Uncharacterized protein n=1 Tax=Lactobacillus phage 521B TaxID=2510942 RepID=A0A4Y5FEE1_9CAUD|nr:hypothetical protein HWC08_gp053 [Lactobacillus phage 521B]QBJ03403.1 hypothetical protein B521_0053 [Lactobacillus phage 521B]